jgi:uncharacterized protein YfaS (alpha-2-macroglobulin family)
VHTLIDAKRLGYSVSQDVIDDALRYLEGEADRAERGEARMDSKYGLPVDAWEPYVHYVLALGGRPRKARALQLAANLPKTPTRRQLEEAYLIKAAVYLAGDRQFENDLRHPDTSSVQTSRYMDYSYWSDERSRGVMLNVYHQLFGVDNADGAKLADVVASALGDKRLYGGTQEVSWGVSGLGRWVSAKKGGLPAPTLSANGRVVALERNAAKNEPTWAIARASEHKTLKLQVPKDLPRAFLIISSTGVRAGQDYRVGGEGLRVERSYRSLGGEELEGTRALGDLIFSEVTIENTSGDTITNIALVDRFPAGWEIENPRLGRQLQVDWVKPEALWNLEYLDLRDDQLQAFGRLLPGEKKTIVYSLRAVTAGQFSLPPVEASAMYDPRFWARSGGGKAEVSAR